MTAPPSSSRAVSLLERGEEALLRLALADGEDVCEAALRQPPHHLAQQRAVKPGATGRSRLSFGILYDKDGEAGRWK